MELLVCIKQVPDTSEIKLDPETNNLIRTGLPSIVNPDDMHALEAALAVKDQYEGSRVTVLAMGPPQAEDALRECLSLGADDAVLVTDRAFGGADTLATSYTIASAIRHIQKTMNRQFEIIFCGKQAIDGDTAQVGPQIAEELGMAQATYACKFSVDTAAQKATVTREHENGYEIVEVPLPLLVTATAELNEPRQPGLWSSIYAKRYEFPILHCVICLILMKAVSALMVPLRAFVRYTNHLFAVKLKCFQTLKKVLKRFSNWRTILSQKNLLIY